MNNFIVRTITGTVLVLGFLFFYGHTPSWLLSTLLSGILLAILIKEWPYLGFLYLTPLYPTLPFALLIYLNSIAMYRPLLLFVITFSLVFDSISYCIGTVFGRHKIVPHISPGKTWEGFIGGILGATAFTLWFFLLFNFNTEPLFFVIFSFTISLLALLGDLFISLLKRQAGLKDSGSLLPGHGGILDRFDSILFVGIFVYFMKKIIITI